MRERTKAKDVELLYAGASESTPYRINVKTTIPEDDAELWKEEVNKMTMAELQTARNHFSRRISGLQSVLDLIKEEIGLREYAQRGKPLTSRRSSQVAMNRSMRGMAMKRNREAFAQFSGKRREHYRPR